jgi:hypothetical protein
VPQAKECRWLPEARKSKAIYSLLKPSKGMKLRDEIQFGLLTPRTVK